MSNLDAFRHAIERLPPLTYLTAGYYGRWLAALETLVVESGFISPEELAARMNDAADVVRNRPSSGPIPVTVGTERDDETVPRFVVGDAVRTRNMHPAGHTRLPRYARGKHGTIVADLGVWVFPDTNAHLLGEHRQHVYSVRFAATELWGVDAEPDVAVHLDLFERYLEADTAHE